MKIVFLIRSLDIGGAERQLIILAKALKMQGHEVFVLVFYAGGALEQELISHHIPIISLEKKHRFDVFGWSIRCHKMIKEIKPDILHSYLTVSNLLSIFLKIFSPKLPVVWGIRASNMDFSQYDSLSRFTHWLEARLSPFANHIIVNAEASLIHMQAKGYTSDRVTIIANGIDTKRFMPNDNWRETQRQAWNILPTQILVGIVARFDPMKDHANFFAAAKILSEQDERIRFVCVGQGKEDYKQFLKQLVQQYALTDKVFFVESMLPVERIYNALDLLCSASHFGEGFSNVIAEAMATGCPAAVTNVGDSAKIVGPYGKVVPAKEPNLLARACLELIQKPPKKEEIRSYIVNNFSQQMLGERTAQLLRRVSKMTL